jgi:hypothetical protein
MEKKKFCEVRNVESNEVVKDISFLYKIKEYIFNFDIFLASYDMQ